MNFSALTASTGLGNLFSSVKEFFKESGISFLRSLNDPANLEELESQLNDETSTYSKEVDALLERLNKLVTSGHIDKEVYDALVKKAKDLKSSSLNPYSIDCFIPLADLEALVSGVEELANDSRINPEHSRALTLTGFQRGGVTGISEAILNPDLTDSEVWNEYQGEIISIWEALEAQKKNNIELPEWINSDTANYLVERFSIQIKEYENARQERIIQSLGIYNGDDVLNSMTTADFETLINHYGSKEAIDSFKRHRVILPALALAVIEQESNSNHLAINVDSGALGYAQIMPDNLPSWSRRAIGREVSVSEFRSEPEIQLAIIIGALGWHLNNVYDNPDYDNPKQGETEKAVKMVFSQWYSGDPELYDDPTPQYYGGGTYPSIQDYCEKSLTRYRRTYELIKNRGEGSSVTPSLTPPKIGSTAPQTFSLST